MGVADLTTLDDNRFGCFQNSKRVWAIGAIHGEVDALKIIHKKLILKFRRGDKLVYLGNYFGNNGSNLATFDEMLKLRRQIMSLPEVFMPEDFVYLRGAREEMFYKLLQIQFAPNPEEVMNWLLDHGMLSTISAYGETEKSARMIVRQGTMALTRWTNGIRRKIQLCPGHTALTNCLKRACITNDGKLLFVHASIDVSRPLTMQKDQFWWDDGNFNKISAPFHGFKKVIRGYDHSKQGIDLNSTFTACLDGGCGRGGQLHTICFSPDDEVLDQLVG